MPDGKLLRLGENSAQAAFTVGSTWTPQFYYRDPAGTAGFNLSDAMRVTWTP